MSDFVAINVLEFDDGSNAVAVLGRGNKEQCDRVVELLPSIPELGGRRVRDHWCVVLPRDEYLSDLLEHGEKTLLEREVGRVGQA